MCLSLMYPYQRGHSSKICEWYLFGVALSFVIRRVKCPAESEYFYLQALKITSMGENPKIFSSVKVESENLVIRYVAKIAN